jgi:LPXTG-motif cell wall-anchored protein
MYNFAKRVTSAVVAGAVVLGTLAFYPGWNKGQVNAATLYDSVNLVNYETVLGRAMDYGIVSARYTQNDHLETTLATKSFTHLRSQLDVDLTTAKTAQFIIGEVTANSNEPYKVYFGTVTNGNHQVYVKNMNIILPDGFNTTDNVVKMSDVATTTTFNYTFMNPADINDSIDKIIDHAKDESDKMVDRTIKSEYVLDKAHVSENADGSLTTIDLDSDEFENRVVYVNLDAPEFNSLISAWGREPGGYHLHINKRSSTVVVFTYQGAADIKIGKVRVEAKDSPLYSSTSDHDSTTDCMGKITVHNDYVDQEIAQKLIWNIPNATNVTLTGSAGTFLALKENVNVTIEGSPSAGWLVSNGKAENTCEFHYIFGGSSEDIQTEGEGQMHFALHKNFSSDYYTKEQLKADPTLIDNSITFNSGAFEFNWQEYSDSSYTTPVGKSVTRSVDSNSIVELPRQTFVTNNSNDPHYVAPGGQPKDFYFRITENPNVKIVGVSNNAGYINICLRVTANTDGKISFKVQSVTMSGEDVDHLITYSTNGDSSSDKWVDMVGPRFDLGAFYNKVVPVVNKGYITITKTVQITDPDADVSKTSFVVKDESGTVWGRYNLKDHFVYDSSTGFYTLKTTCEVPDASKKYFVEETAATVDGYNSVSYYVDDAGKDNNGNSIAFDSVSNDSDNPTKANFKNVYTKDTTKGSLVVTKVLGGNSPSSASYKPFVFSISGPNNYSKSITVVGAGTVRIDGLEPGNYTVTENTADPDIQINGYTLSVSAENGTSVPVSANSTSSISITNTYDAVNEEKGSIVITKTIDGPLTRQDIDGLTFKVFNVNNLTTAVWTGKLSETTGDSPNFRYEGGKYISKELLVPVGNYIVVEELTTDVGIVTVSYKLNSDDKSVTVDSSNRTVTTETFSVADGKTSTLAFTNKYKKGNIVITKTIEGTVTDTDRDNLVFKVYDSSDNLIWSGRLGDTEGANASFSVNNGLYTSKTIEVLPGNYYVVEELTTNAGTVKVTYTITANNNTVNGSFKTEDYTNKQVVTNNIGISDGDTKTLAFKNTYSSTTETGSLTVTKVLSDEKPANAPTEYTFYVKCGNEGYVQSATTGAVAAAKYPFTVTAGNTTGTVISGLKLDKTYTVEEAAVTGLPAGWSCTASYSKSSVNLTSSHKDDSVQITNNFEQKTTPVQTGSLVVSKTISGAPLNELETISFTVVDGANNALTDADGNTVTIPDLTTANVTAGLWKDSGDGKTFTYTVGNLAEGTKCTVTETYNETASSKYTLITTGTNASTTEATVTIEANKEKKAEITNNFEQKTQNTNSSLEIKKTIILPPGASYGDIGTIIFDVIDSGGNPIASVTLNPSNPGTDWNVNGNEFTYTVSPVTEGKKYTVKETCDTTSTTYTATSDVANGESSIVIPVGTPGSVAFTNTYSTVTVYTGSLVITKTIELPSGASMSDIGDITFTISPAANGVDTVVLDPDNPGTGWTVNGNVFTYTISGLTQGESYDINESVDGSTSNYSVTASSSTQGQITIPTDSTGNTSVSAGFTNTYSSTLPTVGYIEFTKTFGGDVTEAEAAGCGLYFVITNEAGEYLDLDGNISSDEVRITLKDMDHTDGTLVWSKTINDVPFDTYYVTEHNEVIYINGGKVPYTFEKTTSVTTDHTTLWNTSEDGYFDLENYYTHPGFDVTISKEDIAGNEIAQAQLKFKSLDGYDLSKVVVTQNGVPVQFTLSENNTAITFTTIEGYPSIIQGLFSGRYELEETVTPEAYLTAEKIVFVLNNDGTITDGEGKISAYGSPVVMIDQADPYYDTEVISANRTPNPIPATGEKSSFIALVGIALVGLCSAALAGLGVYRKKRNEF